MSHFEQCTVYYFFIKQTSGIFPHLPELASKRPLVVIGPDMGLQMCGLAKGLETTVLQVAGVHSEQLLLVVQMGIEAGPLFY